MIINYSTKYLHYIQPIQIKSEINTNLKFFSKVSINLIVYLVIKKQYIDIRIGLTTFLINYLVKVK